MSFSVLGLGEISTGGEHVPLSPPPYKDVLTARVEGILLKTLKNPLFWGVSTLASCLFACSKSIPISLHPITAVGLAALGYIICKNRKELWYELSLTFVVAEERNRALTGHRWYDKVTPHVFLGALPLRNLSHAEQILKEKVGAVLSLVEDFESHTTSLLSVPVLESEWRHHKIEYLRIPTPDLSSPTIERINQAVAYLRKNAEQGIITYTNCKAGRGRSAQVVTCYLLKYHREDIEREGGEGDIVQKAIRYLKTKRPQVTLSPSQKRMIREYSSSIN